MNMLRLITNVIGRANSLWFLLTLGSGRTHTSTLLHDSFLMISIFNCYPTGQLGDPAQTDHLYVFRAAS